MTYASDVASMLKHAPNKVRVTCNGVTSDGVLDRSSDLMGLADGGSLQIRNQVLTVQNGVFPRLREDAHLTINDQPYVIRDVDTDGIDDGELLTFQVTRAT